MDEPRMNSYWLDAENRMVRVGSDWDRFASENDGDKVLAAHVLGRPIWDFIRGDVTRMWYEAVIKLCRLRGSSLGRPYRCDTPNKRRFMQMAIVPEESGLLRFDHTILSVEPIRPPVYFRAALHAEGVPSMRCSMCGHISRDGSKWLEPEPSPAGDGKTALAPLPVIYTVCQECQRLLPNR